MSAKLKHFRIHVVSDMNELGKWSQNKKYFCFNVAFSLDLYHFCGHLFIRRVPFVVIEPIWDSLENTTWVPVLTASQIQAGQKKSSLL